MYFVCFCLLAREYAARGCRYIRGKLIEIHRDWKKTWVSDVCWFLIHRDGYEFMISDVFCFGNWSSPICGVNSPLGIFELCN